MLYIMLLERKEGYFMFLDRNFGGDDMKEFRKTVRTCLHPPTLRTLCWGAVQMLALHCVIKFEQIKENGNFESLDIPATEYEPLGIDEPEIFPESGPDRIPRIIHQTWKTEDVPSKFVPFVKTWVKNQPDWQYYLWTDESARRLIKERHPHLLPVFNGYNEGIRKADALRYIVLYEFGGIYADMDIENLRPLDPWLKKYSCFVSKEPDEHPILDTNFENLVINALMGCKAKHPLMKKLMDNLASFKHMWHVVDSTGPHFVTLIYNDYIKNNPYPPTHENGTYLAPSEYFFPTIDPAKFFWMRHQCSRYNKLTKLQQRACVTIKVKGAKRKPLFFSFTDHHWEHTYIDLRLSLRGPVNIHQIVPQARIFRSEIKSV